MTVRMFGIRNVRLLLLAWLSYCASAIGQQPTEVLPLSGLGEAGEAAVHWDFRLDQGRNAGSWQKIRVPSNWEQEGFGSYYYGIQGRGKPDSDPVIPKERGEYRREFTVPDAWRGRQIRILFDGVMTDTTVRINGRSAGATHQGGFYRFEYDITALVRFDAANLLEVQVDKESANASVNHAERRGDYWTFGGIYRPVWLEARPLRHIDWVAVDARADGSLYAQIHLGGPAATSERVEARVIDAAGRAVGKPWIVELRDVGTAILRERISQPQAWTAETPHLYRLQLRLHNGEREPTVIHQLETRFGFRTFEVRPRDGLYLNGRKIVLKGVNRHSFHPDTGRTTTRAQSLADARAIKDANMNAVRMSHYPPDPHFLEAADELGLYVLDELAGWQGSYDTPTGARLIGQMVRRDVNHPSILFWDNGNEGGWNREVDGEFDRWDPQRRPVLHPWAVHSGINTDHYEKYESTQRLSAGPDIFMPTEFLHGLYDGGIGAGLYDYWKVMSASPTVAGGFFWAWADEGVRRTDQQGRIDNHGNSAADGIVGPYGEKEGSYYAVKQLWSPVQIDDLQLTPSGLSMQLSNRYSFTDLRGIRFVWQVVRLPKVGGVTGERAVLAKGEVRGPELAPGAQRSWQVPIKGRDDFDVVQLAAYDRDDRELWTWSVPSNRKDPADTAQQAPSKIVERGAEVTVQSAPFELTFARASGVLTELRKGTRVYPLRDGPRAVAYRREGRKFVPLAGEPSLLAFDTPAANDGVIARARYDGILRAVTWSRVGDAIAMDYELEHEGSVNIFGIGFDVPESSVRGKRWVGRGPFRVWQNRLEGGRFDVHETAYNNPVPGETYDYPEFQGYFGDWRWLTLQTASGDIVLENAGDIPFFGLYRPQGGVGPVLELPDVGVSLLSVIPAMGSKFDLPEQLGPQSQPKLLSGAQRGRVLIYLP
jgi:beta-galactosidase/beta-glucuronidase